MSSLSNLPEDLILDELLPILPVRSVLSLGATNHQFHKLSGDEALWKLKCLTDFNFSGSQTSRRSGWKFIYKGLSNPKVFVWGDESCGRLGISKAPHSKYGGIPYPIRIKFPKNVAIVELIAGGWSFNALDSQGRVFVWGSMDGEAFGLQSDGFSMSSTVSNIPRQLHLPYPIRSLSCGRKHSTALDSIGNIWTFLSWGRPYRLVSPFLDRASSESTPAQIECGWTFSTVLTESGDVYVWWPFSQEVMEPYAIENARMDRDENKRAYPTVDNIIPCVTWDLQHNPKRLPALPPLPGLLHDEDERSDTKIVKVAGMDNFLVALTNKGHILKFGDLSNEGSLQLGRWEYLPNFCEVEKVRMHPVFTGGGDITPPLENFKINHITAHFERFVAYTESIVLQGSTETTAEHDADIIPALQNKSVISIGLGDYHKVALTADGKLYTWGSFSRGALGLGKPEDLPVGAPGGYRTQQQLDRAKAGASPQVPEVETPTEVHFDQGEKKERFCFAATAAGWHTGALVIDMNPEDEGEDGMEEHNGPEVTAGMPGHFDPRGPLMIPRTSPLEAPFFVPRAHAPLSPFRIGFPGRGRRAGRGRGD